MLGYLAIDEGTTNCKALVVGEDASVQASASLPLSLQLPRAGCYEQDAEEIVSVIQECAQAALNRAPHVSIQAIGLATQRESVVAFDAKSGRPLAPVIGWQDSRTTQTATQLVDDGAGPVVSTKTGLHLDAMYSATKMRWLWDHVRNGHRGTPDLVISTLDAFIVHRLTAGVRTASDATNASRTLLFNLDTLEWDPELAEIFGVPVDVLPEILPSNGEFGVSASFGRLPAGIPIRAVLGDSHAAFFGQRCEQPGIGKITLGTGSSIMVPSERTGRPSPVDTTLGYLTDAARYAREGNVLNSGSTLQTFSGILGCSSVEELVDLATQASAHSVGVVPAFSGLAAPHWDRSAVGIISGIGRNTTRHDVAYGAVASLAHQAADIVDEIKDSGDAVDLLRADGGVTVSPFVMQVMADLTGVRIEASNRPELAAIGAARMASHALGRGAEFDAAPITGTTFVPTSGSHREARAEWADAVARSRGIVEKEN